MCLWLGMLGGGFWCGCECWFVGERVRRCGCDECIGVGVGDCVDVVWLFVCGLCIGGGLVGVFLGLWVCVGGGGICVGGLGYVDVWVSVWMCR